jgi:MFS family permease
MLALDEPSNFSLFALSSILVSLAAVPVALSKAAAPAPIAAARVRIGHLYALSPVGMVGCVAFGLTVGSFWALGPVFAYMIYGNTTGVAAFMCTVVLAGALGQWPLGRLSDQLDRRWILALASVGAAFAGGAMMLTLESWGHLLLLPAFLFGFCTLPLYALSVAHMNDSADPAEYVETAGGLLFVFGLGAITGPIIVSIVIAILGLGGLFAFTTLIHAGLALFIVYRIRQRARTPAEERTDFVSALQRAQTVANIDPSSPAPEV